MPIRTVRKTSRPARDEAGEQRLLAEFLRAPSVAALADSMAKRLGAQAGDLLLDAGLAPQQVPALRRAR